MDSVELMVRRLEARDLELRVAWFNTPAVYRQMLLDIPIGLEATKKWFYDTLLNESRRDFVFSLTADGVTESHVCAMGGLSDISQRHRRAELYVVVRPQDSGKGIGSAVVQWLCNYGFIHLNLWRIHLWVFEHNQRALRLYERLGFVREGVARDYVYHNGRFQNRHLLSLLRYEWEGLPWRVNEEVPVVFPVGLGQL